MSNIVKSIGLTGFAVLAFATAPEQLSLAPAPAAAGELVCASSNYQYSYCGGARIGNARPVIVEQLSRAPCNFGNSWGYDQQGVWVDKGCAAHFAYGDRKNTSSAGSVVGAVVIGGLIGALLGSSDSKSQSHSQNNYDNRSNRSYQPYPVYVERSNNSSRNNSSRNNDSYVDPTPQYDKEGNPNFDTQGNYQGAHGLGALVDNPDDPNN